MTDLNEMTTALVTCDKDKLVGLVNAALADDIPAGDILNQGLIAGMDIVGEKMENGDMFIPEVLMAAQAMGECVTILKPLLGEDNAARRGNVIIGTVKGDLHDIGKNLVAMMMEGAGFSVVDLGVDIDAEKFVKAAAEHTADVVALSALLTTTMPAMEATIAAIKKAGIGAKIIIGGAPVTEAFANQIGADGYSGDAPGAVELARKLFTA